MGKTVTATTRAELEAAFTGSQGGETIVLTAPHYGPVTLGRQERVDGARPVTIRSVDPKRPAVMGALTLNGARHLILEHVVFNASDATDGGDGAAVGMSHCKDVTIRNTVFRGGAGSKFGALLQSCTAIALRDNRVTEFAQGIIGVDLSDLTLENNDISKIRLQGIALGDVRDVRLIGNHLHGFTTPLDQAALNTVIRFCAPFRRITLHRNQVDLEPGAACRAIVLEQLDQTQTDAPPARPCHTIAITENIVLNTHGDGIVLDQSADVTIARNSLIHGGPGERFFEGAPRIRVCPRSRDVAITHNATAHILGWQRQSTWTLRNNGFIQNENPDAPGWYGTVFTPHSLDPSGNGPRFQDRPGGMLDRLQAGAGRPWTRRAPPVPDPPEAPAPTGPLDDFRAAGRPVQITPVGIGPDDRFRAIVPRQEIAALLGTDSFRLDLTIEAHNPGASGEMLRLARSFNIALDPAGDLHFQAFCQGGRLVEMETQNACLSDTKPHVISLRLAQNRLALWIDEALSICAAMPGPLRDIGQDDLRFGGTATRPGFDGSLHALALWSAPPEPQAHGPGSPQIPDPTPAPDPTPGVRPLAPFLGDRFEFLGQG